MSELEVFAAALQITDASERSEYLDRACGPDAALRQRVEVLLRNHENAGSFLQAPAGPPLATALPPDAGQTEPSDAEKDESALAFLRPSSKPGSLGQLGHYEVLEVLGQGGFGTVVRAFDEKLHRMVAIKIMLPRLAATSPARRRFLREARASAAIRHLNVVNIHAIEEQPIPFLVMEYVAGETLQKRIDRIGPLDLADVLRIGVQVAHGLAAAHAMGRIHRDIKPANILLENGVDHVKITDFGLARAADDASVTQSGVIAGTPLYMAPEQAQGLSLDQRADLFSLGSVLYVMCSGRPPFRAATALAVLKRVAEDTPRPIREIMPEVPEWLCGIIAKLHAKKPEDRYQTAQEVAEVLGRHLPVKAESEPAMTAPPPAAPRRRSRAWIPIAGAIGLTLVGLSVSEATNFTNLRGAVVRMFAVAADKPDGDKRPPIVPPEVVPPEVVPSVPADPDRRGAQYVLSVGGTVQVNDHTQPLSADGELPIGAFRLTNVNLVNRKVSADGLARFMGCKHIRQLDLANTNVSDTDLANFKDCIGLTALGLSGTGVSDAGLAHFQGCKALARIDLHGTRVTSDGLAHFQGCKDLGLIAMPRTAVGDAGLLHLQDSKNLATLELGQTQVSDAGLANLTNCKRITDLGLAGTKVSDAGLALLAGFPELMLVNLEKTETTRSAVKQLSFALPTCKIRWNGGVQQVTASTDPERRASEYALAIGGEINIKEGRSKNPNNWTQRNVWTSNDLPLGAFGIRVADLGQNPNVRDTGLAMFQGCKELEALALAGTKVSDAGLAPFKDCTLLQGLDLDGTQIGDEGLAHFAHLRNLVGLGLTGTNVTDTGLGYFKDCERLSRLDLGGTKVSDAGLVIFNGTKSLIQVDLTGTQIGDTGLACLWRCQNMVTLGLGRTKLSDAGLAHFKDCKLLATLELFQTQVGDLGLPHLKNCKALMHLDLAGSQVSDAGLAQLAGFTKLLWLNVKNTKVSEAGAKSFAASMPGCKVVWTGGVIEPTMETDPARRSKEWLLSKPGYLDRCGFVDDTEIGVTRLEGLPKSPYELRGALGSRSSNIPEESLAVLKLNKIRHLTHLYVRNRKVKDTDLRLLKEYVQLKELHLSGTAITDAGLAQLTGFPDLRYLNLKQTAVTEEGVKKLGAALPKCKIEWNDGVIGPAAGANFNPGAAEAALPSAINPKQ